MGEGKKGGLQKGQAGQEFEVLQPGSSVATALSEGEAKPKHVFLLEVSGNDYRVQAMPLTRVRPFLHEAVCLRDTPELDPEDAEVLRPPALRCLAATAVSLRTLSFHSTSALYIFRLQPSCLNNLFFAFRIRFYSAVSFLFCLLSSWRSWLVFQPCGFVNPLPLAGGSG